jgi:hypothetical protein
MPRTSNWLLGVAAASILAGGAAVYDAFPAKTQAPASVGATPADAEGTDAGPSSKPAPSPAVPADMSDLLVGPHKVDLQVTGWYAWALMDLRTGKIFGSKDMHKTTKTASMIKAWIAADYLRRQAEAGKTPSDYYMGRVKIMVQHSDNNAAVELFKLVGLGASTKRMIAMCDMRDSTSFDNWSDTLLSPYDTAKLGACIAAGTAAGPKWTDWLLTTMRGVNGGLTYGDFGIRKAFPADVASTIAIKNGWVDRQATQTFTVNCLAIGDHWSMGVMTAYPLSFSSGNTYGAGICKQVAAALKN